MSRVHKYRAWHTLNKRMYAVSGMSYSNEDGSLRQICVSMLVGKVTRTLECFPLAEVELMEFTGLLDVQGKEIYEGDILFVYGGKRVVEFRTAWWGVASPEAYWKVYEDKTTWTLPAGFGTEQEDSGLFKPLYRYDAPLVIGNVYEHPHLLEKELAE